MADVIRQPCDEGVAQKGKFGGEACSAMVQRWVLVATILGSSMVFINGSTVNVALPALQDALGANVVDIQWIINAYTLMLAALILIGGSLGDHYGRRRMFVWGTVLFTLASVACGLAGTAAQLIAARAVQGIGGALLTPGSLAIISATFPAADGARGRAIGLWSGFSALTSAVGPLLGGWLIDSFSWRWIFFIHLPLAIVVVAISLRFIPESRDDKLTGGLDWGGALLATLGLGLLTYGLIAAGERGWNSGLVIGMMATGIVLLIAFVIFEGRQDEPMVPLGLFRERPFSGANGLTLLLYMALGGSLFFLPLNLIQVQGYSATAAGAAFLPMILILSLLSRWAGGLIDRVGARLPLVVGPLVAGVGYLLFALPGIGGSYWTTFFPALVVLGLGMAISVAPLTTVVMTAVPDHLAGTASGINNAASRVASLLAIALLGVVMLAAFSQQLETGLGELSLPAEAQQTLLERRTDLANMTVPETLPEAQQTAVADLVDRSFVAGFRLVMVVAAVLAFASAGIAGLTIPGKQ